MGVTQRRAVKNADFEAVEACKSLPACLMLAAASYWLLLKALAVAW
jgi:hypothetical protein